MKSKKFLALALISSMLCSTTVYASDYNYSSDTSATYEVNAGLTVSAQDAGYANDVDVTVTIPDSVVLDKDGRNINAKTRATGLIPEGKALAISIEGLTDVTESTDEHPRASGTLTLTDNAGKTIDAIVTYGYKATAAGGYVPNFAFSRLALANGTNEVDLDICPTSAITVDSSVRPTQYSATLNFVVDIDEETNIARKFGTLGDTMSYVRNNYCDVYSPTEVHYTTRTYEDAYWNTSWEEYRADNACTLIKFYSGISKITEGYHLNRPMFYPNLQTMYIPKSVTSLSDLFFICDNNLTPPSHVDIYYEGTEAEWNSLAASAIIKSCDNCTNYYSSNVTMHYETPADQFK